MRDLLSRLAPDSFEDVIAVLALYRPGPLGSGMADMFVRRKHGQEPVEYPHDSLRPILEETYGVIVYQEQVMRIANVLASFTMNQADALRKAMGKKKPEVMLKFKEQFIEGAVQLGHERSFARELFETMEYFAGYGFNKSHSAAYALLTYQTAYLKAHYPTEFLAANLTTECSNSDKVKEFVDEARRMGIEVLPPDVQSSRHYFNVEAGAIRYALDGIKGVGTRAAELVHEERGRGRFRSLEDFCERLDPAIVNKTALEALAQAGAFDGFGLARKHVFDSIDGVIRASAQARDDQRRGQGLLFSRFEAPPPAGRAAEWDELERLAHEKEALGFYLSGHPFHKRGRFYSRLAGHTSSTLAGLPKGTEVRVAGLIAGVRVVAIKNGANAGQKMARFHLEDLDGSVAITCFAKPYQRVRDVLEEDAIVFVKGRVDSDGDDPAILLDDLLPAQQVVDSEVHSLVLCLAAEQVEDGILAEISDTIADQDGEQRLLVEVRQAEDVFRVRTDARFKLRLTPDILDRLADLVGPSNLAFTRR
jgi:DNA polymerase-3 subunit alpha